jgi:hypothetical protein
MKYGFILFIIFSVGITSCTIEKKLYSSGYHIEWLHETNKPQKISSHFENHYIPTPSSHTSEKVDSIEYFEEKSTLIRPEISAPLDTVIPENPSKTEEEYLSPNTHSSEIKNTYDPENIILTQKDQARLDRLTQWLITSAILSILPFYFLYVPIFLVNLLTIRKIKRLAEFSPYKTYYLNKIIQYWRIIIWPLYLLGLLIIIFLILLALYGY